MSLAASVIPEQVRKAIDYRRTPDGHRAGGPPARPFQRRGEPLGQADVHTAVVLPLGVAGRDRLVGALVLGTSPHLRLDDDYRTFLSLAAGQVAAALADAGAVAAERRRAEERAQHDSARAQFFTDVAVTLQRAVLGPTVLPAGFAVHYEPATGTLEVGGDWYDVVDLPDGQYGVVVGDVVGRGLAAAAVMGQLRSAGRALLLESRSPAHVLSALDRFAALVPGAAVAPSSAPSSTPTRAPFGTAAPGIPRRSSSRPTDGPASSRTPVRCRSPSSDDLERPEADVVLSPGSTLLLYTDGLVERRDEVIDEGMARAVEVADRRPSPAAGGIGRSAHRASCSPTPRTTTSPFCSTAAAADPARSEPASHQHVSDLLRPSGRPCGHRLCGVALATPVSFGTGVKA